MPPGTKAVHPERGLYEIEAVFSISGSFQWTKPSGPVILILDGHVSHFSDAPELEKVLTDDVLVLCSLPHCTHKLQTLDVAFFGSLKMFYNDVCRIYVGKDPGKCLNKVAFGGIFAED